jgi:uncharacterized protein
MMKTLTIDNQEFAQKQQNEQGEFVLSSCVRLMDSLHVSREQADNTMIYFALSGFQKQFSHPSLQLTIRTELPALCQRCLDYTAVSLDLHFQYLILADAGEMLDEDDELDWLEPNHEMDVLALIEDELLMAMPIAPVHSHDCGQLKLESGEKANPFAVLKGKIK